MASLLRQSPRLAQIGSSHPLVRQCSAVRRNLVARDERLMAVEGLWAHQRLLAADADLVSFLWCPSADRLPQHICAVVEAAAARCASACEISPRALARVAPGVNPPAMVSVVRLPEWTTQPLVRPVNGLALVADGIQYAGNLGTLVRTVDACRADCLVLTNSIARLTHPKVFTASRGTVLTTPVLEMESVGQATRLLDESGFRLYLADPGAPRHYRDQDYTRTPAAFVVGSEGGGVCTEWRDPAHRTVSIPMLGQADSLNVATSGAILLFEARAQIDTERQRRTREGTLRRLS